MSIRIGCSSAFWGDTNQGIPALLDSNLDVLVADYLAEVTMVVLSRLQQTRSIGYVPDFVTSFFSPFLPRLLSLSTRVVTNAGGLDPEGLKSALEAEARRLGLPCPKIVTVSGDSLSGSSLLEHIRPFDVLGEEDVWVTGQALVSCNVYTGAFPIVQALKQGAQIVITGRCVDSALVLAPLIHRFGWSETDVDRLSSGSLAGHILECGAQSTGGNFTDWEDSMRRGWANMGFPIAECFADGHFVVQKPEGSGGLVSRLTVAEQLVYEIGDPASYILPDVVCDWRDVTLKDVGPDRVLVSGAKGRAAPADLKVCATTSSGFQGSAVLLVPGEDAPRRAHCVAHAIIARTNSMLATQGLPPLSATQIDALGSEALFGHHIATREVVLRIAVRHPTKKGIHVFGAEVAPAATGMAPGITGLGGGGRAKPSPCFSVLSGLLSRTRVVLKVGDEEFRHTASATPPAAPTPCLRPFPLLGATRRVPLHVLCVGRSGDKGDSANIGLICRNPAHFAMLGALMPAGEVKKRLQHVLHGQVERYALPGISGFNYLCTQALGGGGAESLRVDRQGKTYATQLLSTMVDLPLGASL